MVFLVSFGFRDWGLGLGRFGWAKGEVWVWGFAQTLPERPKRNRLEDMERLVWDFKGY